MWRFFELSVPARHHFGLCVWPVRSEAPTHECAIKGVRFRLKKNKAKYFHHNNVFVFLLSIFSILFLLSYTFWSVFVYLPLYNACKLIYTVKPVNCTNLDWKQNFLKMHASLILVFHFFSGSTACDCCNFKLMRPRADGNILLRLQNQKRCF